MACFGIVLGLIGLDTISGAPRLTFDRMELVEGIGLVPIVMGLFGIAEMLSQPRAEARRAKSSQARIGGLLPSRAGLARERRAARARLGARLPARHPAGRRRGDRFVPVLRDREARLEDAGEVRQGRDRRRRRAGSRQQRRGRRRLHSADDARHPAQRGDGDPARRLHRARLAARAAADGAEPRPLLGHRRQHVHRQRDAAGPEPAADRPVGAGAEDAVRRCCSR